MAEQRQRFRFRLPWLQAAPPRPSSSPQATTADIQTTPSQPTTTTPSQRPPFRPAGSAPAQPQASARTESQSSSPSSATTRSQVTSQAPSPSRAAVQSRGASQPPSPSRASTQSQGASLPASPSRATTQSQAASQPPSPSRTTPRPKSATQPPSPSRAAPQPQTASQPSSASQSADETQAASQPTPQTQSPPELTSTPSSPTITAAPAQSPAEAVTQPPLPSEKLQSTTLEGFESPPGSQEEPKRARSQPESEELQPKAEKASDNVLNAQNQTPSQIDFQPNLMPEQPSEASVPVIAPARTSTEAVQPPALDSFLASAEESDGNPEKAIEGKEIIQEGINTQKIDGVTEEPKQRTFTELPTAPSGSKVQTKMHPSVAIDEEQRHPEKEEVISRKETKATSSSNGNHAEIGISNLRDKTTLSESRHKPITSRGEGAPLHKEIRDDISKFVHKMATQQPNHILDERPVSVVTLAGENRGASMQLGLESAKREGSVHIRRGYKVNPDESTEATTDGEGSSKGRRPKYSKTEEDQTTKAYINSNVQGINSSIVFTSSITEGNPGVQLDLSHNLREPVKPGRRIESLETHKAEFNVTPAQKLTYEPTVRRRCLGGLFMEPCDSDPDNPEKPRRHGCQYAYKDKSKDKEMAVP